MRWSRWVFIILWSWLFLLTGHVESLGQSSTWVVRDIISWEVIPEANIQMVLAAGDTISIGRSNTSGEFSLLTDGSPRSNLLFTHPDYRPMWVDWQSGMDETQEVLMQPKLYQIDEVVLSANRFSENRDEIPFQVKVITQRQIALENPSTSADMLEQAGIFVQRSQAGGGSPVLRGFEANRVLLVIDGVRMNNAIYRSGHLQNVLTIDQDLIDRSEVLFGPVAVMYGSDALGGVMHFYTRQPSLSKGDKVEMKINSYARVGTAQQERSLHYDMNVGGKKWAAISSISWHAFGHLRTGNRRSEAYPDWGRRDSFVQRIGGIDQIVLNAAPNIMTPSGYEQTDLFQKFYFLPNDVTSHTLNLQFSRSTDIPRFDRLTQLRNGRLRYAEWYYGPQERLMASYRFLHTPVKGIYDELSVTTAWQDIVESRHNRDRGDDWLSNREEEVYVFSANLDVRKKITPSSQISYGAEVLWNKVNSSAFSENITTRETAALDTRYPDGGTLVNSSAAYFTHRWTINPSLTLSDGIRFTDYQLRSEFVDKSFFPFPQSVIEQNNQALSGNLGLVWQTQNQFKVSGLLSSGFRAPNLDDIAKVFDSQPGNVLVPNPDLLPETTYNAEISVDKRVTDRFDSEITAWYTRYNNAIVVRDFRINGQDSILYDGVLSNVQANVNALEAWLGGVSHTVHFRWNSLELGNSVTWTYGQDMSSDVPLDHIPPLFGQATVSYPTGRWKFLGKVAYQGWKRPDRYSPRDENNAEFATEDGWPAWARLDVKASYRMKDYLQLQAGIDNVLDQHYRSFSSRISAPGRNIWLTLRWSY